jgi:hypothetical protein
MPRIGDSISTRSHVVDPSTLPTEGGELLVDTKAIQRRIDKSLEVNLQWKHMTFAAPESVSAETFERGSRVHIGNWIEKLQGDGLEQKGKVIVRDNGTAIDLTGTAILDRKSYVVSALFKFVGKFERYRIELPEGIVKQGPEHTAPLGIEHKDGLSDIVRAG